MSHGKKTYTAVHRLYTNDGSDIQNRIFGYNQLRKGKEMAFLKIFQNFISPFSQSAIKIGENEKNIVQFAFVKNPFIHSTLISVT